MEEVYKPYSKNFITTLILYTLTLLKPVFRVSI